jgi:predicted  nucleic acid-binding Zn ribbon protein
MPEHSQTPVTFSRWEARKIREMLNTADRPAACPRCDEKLKVDGPIADRGPLDGSFHVRCQTCRRSAFITKTTP